MNSCRSKHQRDRIFESLSVKEPHSENESVTRSNPSSVGLIASIRGPFSTRVSKTSRLTSKSLYFCLRNAR